MSKWNPAPLPPLPPQQQISESPQSSQTKQTGLLTGISLRAQQIREGIFITMRASPPPWEYTANLFGLVEGDVELVMIKTFRDPLPCPFGTSQGALHVIIPLIDKSKTKQDNPQLYVSAVKTARTMFRLMEEPKLKPMEWVRRDAVEQQQQASPQLQTTTAMYKAVVPPNSPPGSRFLVDAGGHKMELMVPEGAREGTELAFKGPAPIVAGAATPPPPAPKTISATESNAGRYKYVDDKAANMKTLHIYPWLIPVAEAVQQDVIPTAFVAEEEPSSIMLPRTSVKIEFFMSDGDREAFGKKLTAFYVKYDPAKPLEDVHELIYWAATRPNGVEELNAKLMKKYGANLTTYEAQSKTSVLVIRDAPEDHLNDLI